jgi:plastocyanin
MKKLSQISLLVVLALLGTESFAGNLTGKVNFKGTAPKAKALKMNADPYCAKENSKAVDETITVNGNGTLKNVFVYVKDAKGGTPVTTPVEFDQKGCVYHPRVVGVMVNQPVKIINSDATLHNVHALPKKNAQFNQGMNSKGQVIEKTFKTPELAVKVKCDVHGWMNAYFNVMDHPFFAVTNEKGEFTINNLPAGDYTVEAWHEKLGTKSEKVKVTDAGGAAEFTYAGT